ncbi:unnamed protein product [Lampetra planeri]
MRTLKSGDQERGGCWERQAAEVAQRSEAPSQHRRQTWVRIRPFEHLYSYTRGTTPDSNIKLPTEHARCAAAARLARRSARAADSERRRLGHDLSCLGWFQKEP